ncbi:MAG: 5'-methylthioadenosine phosphorylase [Rhodospirillaceae bacterium]|nr:MAG: 5'-methylthioadenosine phosphorylase [Rhodospirillaceae bacterium]
MADKTVIGIIGGSGVYEIDGLADTRWVTVNSPFGAPSDDLLCGTLEGVAVVFLPRHGRGHRIPPSALNARANIDALKRAGVTEILSASAVGSLREHLAPGTFVIVDQFIDRTFTRAKSFFETGLVAHVGFGHPVCPRLGDALEKTLQDMNVPHQRGGTCLVMEGPQFSTLAESNLYRSWGHAT